MGIASSDGGENANTQPTIRDDLTLAGVWGNPIWVLLLLGETPGPMAAAGGVIILAAVTLRGIEPWLKRRRLKTAVAIRGSAPRKPVS